MDPIFLTVLIGAGLLIIGYIHGYSKGSAFSRFALDEFIGEMILADILDPKVMAEYYQKKYGASVSFGDDGKRVQAK
jgi:hypothetical protein